jgi:hypothetical protein
MMNVGEEGIIRGAPVTRARGRSAVRLGDTLGEVIEDVIAPQQRRFESIVRLWSELLPAELNQHCRIVDISAGCLKVLVDSASYMYELQLCGSAVLKELQRACPQARLQKIKLAVG